MCVSKRLLKCATENPLGDSRPLHNEGINNHVHQENYRLRTLKLKITMIESLCKHNSTLVLNFVCVTFQYNILKSVLSYSLHKFMSFQEQHNNTTFSSVADTHNGSNKLGSEYNETSAPAAHNLL